MATRSTAHHLDDILSPSPQLARLVTGHSHRRGSSHHHTCRIRDEVGSTTLLIVTSVITAHHFVERTLFLLLSRCLIDKGALLHHSGVLVILVGRGVTYH